MKFQLSFLRVFWVVLACYLALMSIMVIGMLSTSSAEHKVEWSYIFNWHHMISQCLNVLATTLFFYFALNYYGYYFNEKKSFFHYLRFTLIISFAYAIYLFFKTKLMNTKENDRLLDNLGVLFFMMFIYTVFHVGVSLLIAYFRFLREERKQRKVLESQKMQLEVEKSSANLNFLKAQINPHFLHNTLNFLYAKSLPYSPELSEGILTLSDIMRYALSEGNAKDGKAPLRDEIEHVWNVIKINQLRFSNKLNVDFQVNGLVDGVTIIPFALITIVENAFKHGDLKNEEYPIKIRLDIDKNRLRFFSSNKKKTGPKELSTGVGLDNIMKRLELAYGKNYQFNIKDESEFYSSELIIEQI